MRVVVKDHGQRSERFQWLDQTRAGLWRVHHLGERPTYTWQDAVVRWSEEKADKATALEDRVKFQSLDGYLSGRFLHTITRDDVQVIGAAKARESSRATANRYLALVRAVLKRAAGPWQWIEKAPSVTLYPEAKRRVRWLNKEEATRLLDALPTHQAVACARLVAPLMTRAFRNSSIAPRHGRRRLSRGRNS